MSRRTLHAIFPPSGWTLLAVLLVPPAAYLAHRGGNIQQHHGFHDAAHTYAAALTFAGVALIAYVRGMRHAARKARAGITPNPLPADQRAAAVALAQVVRGWTAEELAHYAGMRSREEQQIAAMTEYLTYESLLHADRFDEELDILLVDVASRAPFMVGLFLATLAADLMTRDDWTALTSWWRDINTTPSLPSPATHAAAGAA